MFKFLKLLANKINLQHFMFTQTYRSSRNTGKIIFLIRRTICTAMSLHWKRIRLAEYLLYVI